MSIHTFVSGTKLKTHCFLLNEEVTKMGGKTYNSIVYVLFLIYSSPQMAIATSSITLSDKNLYPYFFRTISSAAVVNQVQLTIMKEFQWDKVAILYEINEPHAGVSIPHNVYRENQMYTENKMGCHLGVSIV